MGVAGATDVADGAFHHGAALVGTDAQSVIAVVQDLDVHSEQVSVVSGGLEGVIVPPTNDVSRAVALFHIVGVDLGILIVGDVGQDAAVEAIIGAESGLQQGVAGLDGLASQGVTDGLSLQGVPDHLGGVVTGQSGVHVDALDAGIQANAGSVGVDVDGPRGVVQIAFLVGVIAQGDQQHLSQLSAGHVAGGSEAVAAHAGQDALGHAVLDVLVGPSVSTAQHVVERRHAGVLHRVLAAIEHDSDHLGSFTALDVLLGLEAVVLVAVRDAQCGDHVDGLFVHDLVLIRERCARAHDHDRQQHSHAEHQAQNLLPMPHSALWCR